MATADTMRSIVRFSRTPAICPAVVGPAQSLKIREMFVCRWFEQTVPGLCEKYPGKVFECIQPAGSLIHVPRNWWHAVWNVEASVAVTHNYIPRASFEEVWTEANAAAIEMETEDVEEFCAKYVSNHFGFGDFSAVREWCRVVVSCDVV